MKSLKVMVALVLVFALSVGSALACTTIYVGSSLTDDGSAYFGRSEDYASSYNKLMYLSPAGNHKAGEVYEGCFGFTFTFEHDSYAYTAFSDDNGAGAGNVCPDCGDTHAHTPYEAAGTNSEGFSMTATESLRGIKEVTAVDPMTDLGIEEAEITTVLLSSCASAKEALALLTKIYDEVGAAGGSGIVLADHNEAWYIENLTGHQYIAVKMSDTMVMVEPNMPIIGLVNLNDTENVVASQDLIKVAQEAGTFVGDAEKNIINFNASYASVTANARMKDALKYFNAEKYDFAESEPDIALYSISNVDAEGNIVAMHTGIELDHVYGVADVLGLYDVTGIGKAGNTETHVFQIGKEDSLTDTVEWVAINDAQYNIFVPYYPMLTTEVYAACNVSTPKAEFVTEKPEAACYPTTKRVRENGETVNKEGFLVYPANWKDSMYWSMDVLAHTIEGYEMGDKVKGMVIDVMNQTQAEVIANFEAVKAAVAAAETTEAAAAIATEASLECAKAAHEAIIEMAEAMMMMAGV